MTIQSNPHSSQWINEINNMLDKNKYTFCVKNLSGKYYEIECEKINGSDNLNEKIKQLSPLLVDAYSNIELDFAKKFPALVKDEMFLKSLSPLISEEIVDWAGVEVQLKGILQKFFVETDWKQFSKENDIHIFSVIKEKSINKILGMAQFLTTNDLDYGNIKIALYDGINPSNTNQSKQFLLSSIFKIIPTVSRLFLHTRISNENGIAAHKEFGFTEFSGSLPNWIDLEYNASSNNHYLQSVANSLVELR